MLIVLGWMVLVILTFYGWMFTIGGFVLGLKFSGKVSWALVIPLAISIGLSYLVVQEFPFELAVKVAQ